MKSLTCPISLVLSTLLLSASSAFADPIQFTGMDLGATAAPYTNSNAAATALNAAASAYGSVHLITFEGATQGFPTLVTVAPGVTVTQTGSDYGPGFSGLTTESSGAANLYGDNTTPGGSEYLAVAGDSTTFNFATPTNSFGFYATGLQTTFTDSISFAFNDGTVENLNFTNIQSSGVEYFGITDASSFSSITITDNGSGPDAWGIDDVTYNSAAVTASATPEPSSLVLLGTGALAAVGTVRRRFKK